MYVKSRVSDCESQGESAMFLIQGDAKDLSFYTILTYPGSIFATAHRNYFFLNQFYIPDCQPKAKTGRS